MNYFRPLPKNIFNSLFIDNCFQNAEFEDLSAEVSNLREISETAFSELKKNELQFTTSVKKLKTTEFQL